MHKRSLCILLSAACCAAVLTGCSSDTEQKTILDNQADYSINIALPYATITPLPNAVEQKDALVIDGDGKVTVNDSASVLEMQPVTSDSDESNYKTLSLGNTGIAVQALQTRLLELGYYTKAISGIFDEETDAAVRRFEQTYGTMQTGVATARLQARLFSADAPQYGSAQYDDAVVSQYTILQRGDVGSSVYALQQRLQKLGYPISEISGVFDDETATAVMLFYEAYGLAPDDTANVALQKELYSDSARAYAGGTVDGAATGADTHNADILNLQNRLAELGYMTGAATGTYDTATQIAVKLFAEACGRVPSDTIDAELQTLLTSDSAPAFSIYENLYSNLIEGASGESVGALQQRLIDLGYASGAPNSNYGAATTEAVKLFQRFNGLEETGAASVQTQAVINSSFALNIDGAAANIEANADSAEPDAALSVSRSLEIGASGADVLRLQNRLLELGYAPSATGRYDNLTAFAVVRLQRGTGLTETARADENLQLFAYSNAAPASDVLLTHSQYENMMAQLRDLQIGSSGDDVFNLQKRLWEFGLLTRDSIADSVSTYNDATAEAVREAQRELNYETADGLASAALQSYLFSDQALEIFTLVDHSDES